MKSLVFFTLGFLFLATDEADAQWEIRRVEAQPMEAQTSEVSEDFWLRLTLRNTSKKVIYVQGIEPNWFMIEAFIRKGPDAVWERQNTGVDRELVMIPVAPGDEIVSVRRESVADIGKSMMLTFLVAHSPRDTSGSRVLLGDFKIPALPKSGAVTPDP